MCFRFCSTSVSCDVICMLFHLLSLAATYLRVYFFIYIYKILRPYAGSKVPEKLPCYERVCTWFPGKIKNHVPHQQLAKHHQQAKFRS